MPTPDDACIFHIMSRREAAAARLRADYRAPSLDTEGFIHLSRAHQVLAVVTAFYAGQTDLVLLVVDPGSLTSPLRYEAPAHPGVVDAPVDIDAGQLFPHLYGPLNSSAIVDVVDVSRFDGTPVHADTAAVLRHYRFDRLPVEGTLYKSTWRSGEASSAGAPAGTAMIGMYAHSPQSLSCFHRLAHDEVWHFYSGDAVLLFLMHADGRSEEVRMGTDLGKGERVQLLVPAGVWQAGCLAPGGRYALFGCTMAPGFTGTCFEGGVASELVARYPDRADVIRRLSVNGDVQRMPEGFAT